MVLVGDTTSVGSEKRLLKGSQADQLEQRKLRGLSKKMFSTTLMVAAVDERLGMI